MNNTKVCHTESGLVEALSGSHNCDGTVVNVRCLVVSGADRIRYELLLETDGDVAIVDVAGFEELLLQQHVDDAVRAFVDTHKLRLKALSPPHLG